MKLTDLRDSCTCTYPPMFASSSQGQASYPGELQLMRTGAHVCS